MSASTIPAQGAMVRRILRHYRSAAPAVHAAGASWYAAAEHAAAEMWPERPDLAAGVIAALSPRCQWVTNLAWARTMIAAARRGDAVPPAVHTTAMRGQAWRIANGEAPLSVLNGPKVRAFYANVSGEDRDAVTVDVWAIRAAIPGHPESIPVRTLRAVQDAYRRAARIAGVDASAMQAVVWVQVRGRAA